MWLLAIYLLVFFGIGLFEFFRAKNFDDFTLAGKKQSAPLVTLSILATIIGASATIGMMRLGQTTGFPAFWWLGVGAIGLILQSLFLTKKVRALNAYSLPDVAEKTLGAPVRRLTAIIIVIAWLGIIAAQFVAVGSIVTHLLHLSDATVVIIISAAVVILYTLLGGQATVLKTDFLQFGIIIISVIAAVVYLFFFHSAPSASYSIVLLNDKFDGWNLAYFLFIFGSAYFVGPDMFSRVLTTKDENTASKASLWAGLLLIVCAVLIALLGEWSRVNLVASSESELLGKLLNDTLPDGLSVLFSFGLLSAVISSAVTCLVTVGIIFEHDIRGKKSTRSVRLTILIVGVIAVLITLFRKDIIGLLTMAYSVYAPGVVMPLFIAIIAYGKRKLRKLPMFIAILVGGTLGLLSNLLPYLAAQKVVALGFDPNILKYSLGLGGIGISLTLALFSIRRKPILQP